MKKKQNKPHLLLVSTDYPWQRFFDEALAPLLTVETISNRRRGLACLRQRSRSGDGYAIVVVDAGTTADVPAFVQDVLAIAPHSRVVVVTAAPDWRAARASLTAGASDYLSKSLDRQQTLAAFRKILHKKPRRMP
jgi:DNA-binding NtrC family response regulator